MIKLIVLYPNGEGKKFDMDYYCNKHIPMVAGLLGDAVKGATVENGLSGEEPGSTPPYLAVGNLYFDTLEDFQKSFGPHSDKIGADIPNYTNIDPVILISKVMM